MTAFNSKDSKNLVNEDVITYGASRLKLQEYESGLEYRYQEGRAEMKEDMISIMKEAGVSSEIIKNILDRLD